MSVLAKSRKPKRRNSVVLWVTQSVDGAARASAIMDQTVSVKMSKWSKRKQCSAINCKNYQSTRSDLAFHRFPKDAQRCARWVQNLRNASLHGIPLDQLHRSYRVCSAHFHSRQFKRPSDVHGGLNWDAVPAKIEAPDPPPPLDVERKRKPPKTRQELPRKKRKQSHVPPPSKDQHTEEAVAGPSSRAQYAEEAVAGPSSRAQYAEEAVAGPSSRAQYAEEAVAGPSSRAQYAEEAVAGPSSRAQYAEEAVAGPSSRAQYAEEAVAGPSSRAQYAEEAVAGPSSRAQYAEEAVAGPSSRAQYAEEAVAGPSSMEEGDIEDVSAAPSSVQRHVCTAALREHSLTMKIRALKTQVSKLRSKVKQLRQTKDSRAGDKEWVMKELQRLLPAKAFAFVRTQLRMSQRKCQGYRWTTQDKAFFLSLWHASPQCYWLLCRVFSMPSVRTLQKTIQAVDFKTGFNNTVLATTDCFRSCH